MRTLKSLSIVLAIMALYLFSVHAFGATPGGGGGNLASLAGKVGEQATAIAKLMNIAAYVAGVGFALAGILQFKAHKEAPQQTPLSKPVVMIVVAACLLFLPTILQIAGGSLFEGGKAASTVGGISEGE